MRQYEPKNDRGQQNNDYGHLLIGSVHRARPWNGHSCNTGMEALTGHRRRSTLARMSQFKERLERGDVPLGPVVTLADAAVTEVLSTCGYDFVWIDTEHTSLERAQVSAHIVAARGRGITPLVRVSSNDPVVAKPFLDMGAAGIIFPMIGTREDAERAVSACRYPPGGVRGFGPLRANMYGSEPIEDYLRRSETEPWVILQIETEDGVRNLEAICDVPGIFSLVIGPYDLSVSLGMPGRFRDPALVRVFDEIVRIAKDRKMRLGAFTSASAETVNQWLARGISWLALETDVGLLARAGQAATRLVHPSD
jgi:2-keto-3-deoxy-L-rhamnonate aldolase RhmA